MKKILFLSLLATIGVVQFVQAQTITKKLQDIKGLHPTYLEFSAADAPAFIKENVWVQNEKLKLCSRQLSCYAVQLMNLDIPITVISK